MKEKERDVGTKKGCESEGEVGIKREVGKKRERKGRKQARTGGVGKYKGVEKMER